MEGEVATTANDGWMRGLFVRVSTHMASSRARLRANRAISAAHLTVLILGIFTLLIGLFYLAVNEGFYAPSTLVTFVVAVILIFLGLIETLVEAESDTKRGRRQL